MATRPSIAVWMWNHGQSYRKNARSSSNPTPEAARRASRWRSDADGVPARIRLGSALAGRDACAQSLAHRPALVARRPGQPRLLPRRPAGRPTADHLPRPRQRRMGAAGILMTRLTAQTPITCRRSMGGWPSRVRARATSSTASDPKQPMPGRYVELHCHSAFSLHEGTSRPEELVGSSQGAWLPGAGAHRPRLASPARCCLPRPAKKAELQAIIGAEITLSDGAHLTLLCETPRGYANLSRLLSRANLNSPRGEPRVRFEWLAEHAEGLIALSGCRKGEVAALAEARRAAAGAMRPQPATATSSAPRTSSSSCRTTWSTKTRTRNEGLVALAREPGPRHRRHQQRPLRRCRSCTACTMC